MSNPLVEKLWDQLTLLPEGSHVRTIPTVTSGGEKVEKVLKETSPGCGLKCGEWLASYNLNTSQWKTYQPSLPSMEAETFARFLSSWPKAGIMRNGNVYTRQHLERPTTERGSSWLLTPTASDRRRYSLIEGGMWSRRLKRSCGTLPEQLFRLGARGHLNPRWISWLMGFPIDHANLKPSEMP